MLEICKALFTAFLALSGVPDGKSALGCSLDVSGAGMRRTVEAHVIGGDGPMSGRYNLFIRAGTNVTKRQNDFDIWKGGRTRVATVGLGRNAGVAIEARMSVSGPAGETAECVLDGGARL